MVHIHRLRLDYPIQPYGYWRARESDKDPLPWPYAGGPVDGIFLAQVSAIETAIRTHAIDGAGTMAFMGTSTSRLTGQQLGCREYHWCDDAAQLRHVWPEDYAPHYLTAGVPPDPGFVALIGRMSHLA